jgi:hypothetical protein
MTKLNLDPSREQIIESMLELARCSKRHRIIVAGSKGPQLMFDLHCRGYHRVATTMTCGLHRQYDAALVDWEGNSLRSLETTLDWLVHFLDFAAVLVIRAHGRERGINWRLKAMLDRLGFRLEVGSRSQHSLLVMARRRDAAELSVPRERAA